MPPRWPRGCTSRRIARRAAVHSRMTSQPKRTSVRVALSPLAKNAAVAGVGLLLRLHPAHGEDHVLRLAGEEVAAAGAAVDQQADAGAAAPLDLGAVRRRRARHHRRRLLLHPAERRDVLVRTQQDARLAGAGLRGEVRLPLGQTMRLARPAGHVRRVPVAHRPAQHGQREPVDLEVDDPGDVGRWR